MTQFCCHSTGEKGRFITVHQHKREGEIYICQTLSEALVKQFIKLNIDGSALILKIKFYFEIFAIFSQVFDMVIHIISMLDKFC